MQTVLRIDDAIFYITHAHTHTCSRCGLEKYQRASSLTISLTLSLTLSLSVVCDVGNYLSKCLRMFVDLNEGRSFHDAHIKMA